MSSSNNGGVDISVLEGWLIKEKGHAPKYSFLADSNRRWFKVQSIASMEGEELALCYFQNKKAKEPRGWIFAKDVTEVVEDKVSITIISPARTLKLRAETRAEHKLWAKGIKSICQDARYRGIGDDCQSPRSPAEAKAKEQEDRKTGEGSSEKNTTLRHPRGSQEDEGQSEEDEEEEEEEEDVHVEEEKGREKYNDNNDYGNNGGYNGSYDRRGASDDYQYEQDNRGRGGDRYPADGQRGYNRERLDTPYDYSSSSDRNRSYRNRYDDDDMRNDPRRGRYDRDRGGYGYDDRGGYDPYYDDRGRGRYYEDDRSRYQDRGGDRNRDWQREEEERARYALPHENAVMEGEGDEGEEDAEQQEYEKWREARRQQAVQQAAAAKKASLEKSRSGNRIPVAVQRQRSNSGSSQTATSRMHQHIRQGSSSGVEEAVLPDDRPTGGDSTPKPMMVVEAPVVAPREFLQPSQTPPVEAKKEEEKPVEPAPPQASAPPAPKVKRTAADDFKDDDDSREGKPTDNRPSTSEAGKWDRFTTSRPLQDVRDDDSDEEGIDLEAEKRRLMLTRVNSAPRDKQQLGGANPPSSGPEPSRSGQEAKEAKPQAKDEVPPPKDTVPDLDLPPEKPLPSRSSSKKLIRAPSGPPPTSLAGGPNPARVAKTARPVVAKPPTTAPPPVAPTLPSVKADENFVEEDWDADDKGPSGSNTGLGDKGSSRGLRAPPAIKPPEKKFSHSDSKDGSNSRSASQKDLAPQIGTGIKADDNWLSDDFDS